MPRFAKQSPQNPVPGVNGQPVDGQLKLPPTTSSTPVTPIKILPDGDNAHEEDKYEDELIHALADEIDFLDNEVARLQQRREELLQWRQSLIDGQER